MSYLRLKCTKFDFGWGSAPDPAGRAYSAPPDPQLDLRGPASNGRGGKRGQEGRGGEGKRGGGKAERGEGGKGRRGEGKGKMGGDWPPFPKSYICH